MGALPQALQIIFELQRDFQIAKGLMKNNKKKNKLFNLQNVFFFSFFFSLDPSYFQTS
jgi:hypothetical protein